MENGCCGTDFVCEAAAVSDLAQGGKTSFQTPPACSIIQSNVN